MNIATIDLDTDFLAGSTSATYAVASKRRNHNIAYHNMCTLIWESAGGWHYDDTNSSTLPVAYSSLVNSQQDYTLPTTAQRLHGVQIKDKGGNWIKLTSIDDGDMLTAPQNFQGTGAGLPQFYSMLGRSIMLYPAPNSAYCTLVSGIGIIIDRDITEIPVTASTTTPGFAVQFHRYLPVCAALDFTQDENNRKYLLNLKDRLERGAIRFYSKREIEYPTRIKPASQKRWRLYK